MHTLSQPTTDTPRNTRHKQHPLIAYVVLAFAITWVLVLLFPRPPLWAAALLDLGLVAVLAWRLRPGTPRTRT